MKEVRGDVFDFIGREDICAICITTNGIVGANNQACMGAGTAGSASERWPGIRKVAGDKIRANGNVPVIIGLIDQEGKYHLPDPESAMIKNYQCLIISFPTKNHFKDPAIPELIKQSAEKLVKLADDCLLTKKIVIPAPGTGAYTGKLSWEKDVKPMIADILDDRFLIAFLESK